MSNETQGRLARRGALARPLGPAGGFKLGDRLIVSRERLGRLQALANLDRGDVDGADYAQGVADALAYLLDPDHPTDALSTLLEV